MSKIIYVDCNNDKGSGGGTSWKTAFRSLQDALSIAQKGAQVWVARGTYVPTEGSNRYSSFFLKPEIELYGGFDGTEEELSQRDWEKNKTVLSGNIGNPDDRKTNCFHVVVGADNSVLDGFVVRDGNGLDNMPRPLWGPKPGSGGEKVVHLTPDRVVDNMPIECGAGMLIYQCALEVRNCVFKDNVSGKGAGLYVMVTTRGQDGSLVMNKAPVIKNCSFINNYSLKRGGGVSNDMRTDPTYINCRFIDNKCGEKGGGMYNDFSCSPTLYNCLFVGNSALMAGAMGNDGRSCPKIINCTITRNHAHEICGGVYQGTGSSNNPEICNSIIWGNICDNDEPNFFNWHESSPSVSFSCIEGGYPGFGNFDQDPKFADPYKMDFRLASMSPCIDAGNGEFALETDIDGFSRYDDRMVPNGILSRQRIQPPFDGRRRPPVQIEPVDIGAFERQEDSVVTPMKTIYVLPDQKEGDWDGASWKKAYRSLQKAMDHAYACNSEVWVAAGTYRPTATSNREISFMLRDGIRVYGGFKGDETSIDQRNPVENITTLSGEIGGTSSFHVLIGANNAVLDGFTISGGRADGMTFNKKGGALINYAIGTSVHFSGPSIGYSTRVINCIFRDNHAMDGGAVYNYHTAKPEFINCLFMNNSAVSGGAVMDNVGPSATYDGCTFKDNSSRYKGGALFLDYGSRPLIRNCSFENNRAGIHGGAIYTITRASQLESTVADIEKCVFIRNSSGKRGGAVMNFDNSYVKLNDCTFKENSCGSGGGAIATDFDAETTISNCVFEGNSAGSGENDIDRDDTGTVKTS